MGGGMGILYYTQPCIVFGKKPQNKTKKLTYLPTLKLGDGIHFLMMAYFLDILLCAARFTSKSKIPFQASKNDVKENGIGDESMEVDGVKKSPSAPKVPSLKKQASFQSALSVLQQMVNEYDDQGFTPLLLACEMYMNYTKPPKRNNVSLYHLHKCAF